MVPASLGLCMGPCLRVWGSSPVRLAAAAAVVPERARPLEVELGVAEEGAVEQRQQPWHDELAVQPLHRLDRARAELRDAPVRSMAQHAMSMHMHMHMHRACALARARAS